MKRLMALAVAVALTTGCCELFKCNKNEKSACCCAHKEAKHGADKVIEAAHETSSVQTEGGVSAGVSHS